MNNTTPENRFKILQETIRIQQEKIKEDLIEYAKELISENNDVIGVCWKQYIPTFNDGEPCTFTVSQVAFVTSQKLNEDEIDQLCEGEDFVEIDSEYSILENGWGDKFHWDEGRHIKVILDEFTSYLELIEGTLRQEFRDNAFVIMLEDRIIHEYSEPPY